MKLTTPRLMIIIGSILIGIMISNQMKLNLETITPVTIKSIIDSKNELDSIKREIINLEKTIEAKYKELELLESTQTGEASIVDILKQDVRNNKIQAGYSALKGPGIEIVMFDNIDLEELSFNFSNDIIHDVDILNIINDLRIAGAEAISINDQRVMSSSEIKCGGPIIRINGVSIGTPFIIKAIGDPQMLMASINAPGTYGHTLRTVYGIGINPYSSDNIVILGYQGIIQFDYAKPVGEGG